MAIVRARQLDKDQFRVLYGLDGSGPVLWQDLISAVSNDFGPTDRLTVDLDVSNPSMPRLSVVRDLTANLDVKVTGIVGEKDFEWTWDRMKRKATTLVVDDFIIYSHFRVLRYGKEVDRGMITEPRGDRHYFSGLSKLYPEGGNYFLEIPARVFAPVDIIQFSHSW